MSWPHHHLRCALFSNNATTHRPLFLTNMHKFGVGQMLNVLMSYCHQGCIIELKYCTIVIDSCDEFFLQIFYYYQC